jgi:hypothetical protein
MPQGKVSRSQAKCRTIQINVEPTDRLQNVKRFLGLFTGLTEQFIEFLLLDRFVSGFAKLKIKQLLVKVFKLHGNASLNTFSASS